MRCNRAYDSYMHGTPETQEGAVNGEESHERPFHRIGLYRYRGCTRRFRQPCLRQANRRTSTFVLITSGPLLGFAPRRFGPTALPRDPAPDFGPAAEPLKIALPRQTL